MEELIDVILNRYKSFLNNFGLDGRDGELIQNALESILKDVLNEDK